MATTSASEVLPAQGTPAIAIAGLRKSFGDQLVLDGLDLEVARGETMAVLGMSGSGKSVLLKLVIRLQEPDGGGITINGEEMTALPRDRVNEVRKKIGFLFQDGALYDSLTLEENIAFPLERHSNLSGAERQARARELLARVRMEKDAAKLPSEISGGMKKRVGLARALALDPDILLLDEPTAGLDPITAADIIDLIGELRRERQRSAILVTHDLRSLDALADRVALLRDGSILAEGPLREVEKSDDPFVSRFMKLGR